MNACAPISAPIALPGIANGVGTKHYVLGFAFSGQSRVALILKSRPTWQAGLLNGIGGKIEGDETPLEAMRREFREETGADVAEALWRHFGVLHGPGFVVWCFETRDADLSSLRTMTDEPIVVLSLLSDAWHSRALGNLPALIYSALDVDAPFLALSYRSTAEEMLLAFDASQPTAAPAAVR